MGQLASIYTNQGRWKDAEKLEMQAMKTYKTRLGADHPDTMSSIANLALIYKVQGRSEEAAKLLKPVIEIVEAKLKERNHHTRGNISILLSTLKKVGRLDTKSQWKSFALGLAIACISHHTSSHIFSTNTTSGMGICRPFARGRKLDLIFSFRRTSATCSNS